MTTHLVHVHAADDAIARENQLTWKIAEVAADPVGIAPDVADMIACRILDSAGVSVAALGDSTVRMARAQALAHPRGDGATLLGRPHAERFSCGWAAWANHVALRRRDMNDMFVGAEYAHPSDSIPALTAVAQQCGCDGRDLLRAIATAYEIQISLAASIALNRRGFDPIGHLGPALVAGLGTLLRLPVEVIHHALQQAVHLSLLPRRLPETVKSDWRVVCAAHVAKQAIEVVDRAMQGLVAPSPSYESPQGIIARFLGGRDASYHVTLPSKGEAKRRIFASYPKAHQAQYQSQAFIDLAFRLKPMIGDLEQVDTILVHTSRHVHTATGTGWTDPPEGAIAPPRLDNQLAFIMAVALEDGEWRGDCTPERSRRPSTMALRRKIVTTPNDAWSQRSHVDDPAVQSFGGEVVVTLNSGRLITRIVERPDSHAHSPGWSRPDYEARFRKLCAGRITPSRVDAFITRCLAIDSADREAMAHFNLVAEDSGNGFSKAPGLWRVEGRALALPFPTLSHSEKPLIPRG